MVQTRKEISMNFHRLVAGEITYSEPCGIPIPNESKKQQFEFHLVA